MEISKNVLFPDFKLDRQTVPGLVALNVGNLNEMSDFYQKVIGLTLLKKNQETVLLGAGSRPLVKLIQVNHPLPRSRKTGLYHTAFLLPSRKELGSALYHYVTTKAPVTGGADHGYSEAIYLTDPEDNGIEVYHDKPREEWDIRADGEIVGVTEELAAQEVIDLADRNWHGFPEGTVLGHVHLKVSDLDKTEQFYTDSLGLSLKNNFGKQAKFFATGDYHHHIGANSWESQQAPAIKENDLGLAYFTFYVKNEAEFSRLEKHWQEKKIDYQKEKGLWLRDPNGIKIGFEQIN